MRLLVIYTSKNLLIVFNLLMHWKGMFLDAVTMWKTTYYVVNSHEYFLLVNVNTLM